MHCCLHLCGQQVSVGRVDQLLISYYRADVREGMNESQVHMYLQVQYCLACIIRYYT